ncbi:hypothetical protein ACQEUR_20350, partial [Plantactinospora sp. CA-290183]
FLMMGLFPLGALLGGVLGEFVGLRPTLWLSGVLVVLSALPVHLVLRRVRDVEDLPGWRIAPRETPARHVGPLTTS